MPEEKSRLENRSLKSSSSQSGGGSAGVKSTTDAVATSSGKTHGKKGGKNHARRQNKVGLSNEQGSSLELESGKGNIVFSRLIILY